MDAQKEQFKSSNKVGDEVPKLLSKKWLCYYFGLYSAASGRTYSDILYSKVLTNNVLAQVGVTEEEIRQCHHKVFTREQSIRLVKLLQIE